MIPDEVIIRAGTNMLAHTNMVPLRYAEGLATALSNARLELECCRDLGVNPVQIALLVESIDNALRGE